MDFSRTDRLQSQIVKEISAIIVEDLKDTVPHMLTITRAEITRDLRHAKIYFSVLKGDNAVSESIEFLKRHNGIIKKMLGKRMRIRRVPELWFEYDSSTDNVLRINELLKKIKDDENAS
jgi:ribosome-binding factor A